jgi:prevent-host-death family protein
MADETQPISEARANLTELAARVRLLRLRVMLTQRGKPGAVLVPAELDAAVDAAGGLDAAIDVLRRSAARRHGPAKTEGQ